jgi:hypothetical protein
MTTPPAPKKKPEEAFEEAQSDAQKPAQGHLAAIFEHLDKGVAEATARVSELQAERAALIDKIDIQIEVATRELAALTAMIALRDGKSIAIGGVSAKAPRKASRKAAGGSGAGGGSPRGDIPRAVLDLLTQAGKKGLGRADILAKLQIGSDDKKGQTSVSNALSSGKRTGKYLHHDDGSYTLNA